MVSQLHARLFGIQTLYRAKKRTYLHTYIYQSKMGGAGPKAYMGWWGHMGAPTQKYINIYTVTPYATKPLKGNLYNAVFNTFRRTKNQALYVIIPAVIVWNIWARARDYNEYLYTKAGREELEIVNA